MAGLPAGWVGPGTHVERVALGHGGAYVFRLLGAGGGDYVKTAGGALGAALREEARKLDWLHAHGAPVARLVDLVERDDVVAFRAEGLPGRPAVQVDLAPEVVVRAVGHALRRLHALPVADWPFGSADAARLAEAGVNLRRRTLKWPVLSRRRLTRLGMGHGGTTRAPVIVHGDADLANVIVSGAGEGAFIDCGAAGLADRYLDLYEAAFAIDARFGEDAAAAFFAAYGEAAPDHAALAYYRALDAFF